MPGWRTKGTQGKVGVGWRIEGKVKNDEIACVSLMHGGRSHVYVSLFCLWHSSVNKILRAAIEGLGHFFISSFRSSLGILPSTHFFSVTFRMTFNSTMLMVILITS